MKQVFWQCRNCQSRVKMFLEDGEAPFTAEGGTIDGYCELCFDAYCAGGLEAFEKRRRPEAPASAEKVMPGT